LVGRYLCDFTRRSFLTRLIINPKIVEFLFALNEREVHGIMVFYSQKIHVIIIVYFTYASTITIIIKYPPNIGW
jgi:hypothetical protein